jgi:hypothetical protein
MTKVARLHTFMARLPSPQHVVVWALTGCVLRFYCFACAAADFASCLLLPRIPPNLHVLLQRVRAISLHMRSRTAFDFEDDFLAQMLFDSVISLHCRSFSKRYSALNACCLGRSRGCWRRRCDWLSSQRYVDWCSYHPKLLPVRQ